MNNKIDKILNKINEIDYGWVDQNKIIHHSSKRQFFIENYHLEDIEDILKYKVGTCFDQVELTRYYFKLENIDIKTYIIIYNDDTKIASHTIAVLESNNKFYYLENTWKNQNNNIEYNTLEELLNSIIKTYPRVYKINNFDKSKIEIYQYEKPPLNLSYQEFTNYCRNSKRIEIEIK